MRDHRADAAAEQAIDEALRFRAHRVGAGDRGTIEIAAPVGLGGHRALLDQPRDQRLHRRLRPAVGGTDALRQLRRGLRRLLPRSEEHTSELQSLMRISYALFCLKKKTIKHNYN